MEGFQREKELWTSSVDCVRYAAYSETKKKARSVGTAVARLGFRV